VACLITARCSMRDYVEHLESKHVGKLLDYLDDQDIVFFINALVNWSWQDASGSMQSVCYAVLVGSRF
jgi:hypothetical protein